MTALVPPSPPLGVDEDVARTRMSMREFLALPDDANVDRMLIAGELWERPTTVRSRVHAFAETRIAQRLQNLIDDNDFPAQAGSGEAGVLFEPLVSAIGIDVVVVSAETLAEQDDSTRVIRGVPLMTVEILSGSETVDEIDAKLRICLKGGVKLCWIVDARNRTVTAHRPGQKPRLFSGDDIIDAEPALPGFQLPTVKLFER